MKNQKLLIVFLLGGSFFLNACRKCDEPQPCKNSHANQQQGFCGTTCDNPHNTCGSNGNNGDNPNGATTKTGH